MRGSYQRQGQTRPFANTSTNRYYPLKALYSDTTGPLSQHYHVRNKYLQLIVDVGSGYLAGEALPKISGAMDSIIKAMARLQRIRGRTVDRFHKYREKSRSPTTSITSSASKALDVPAPRQDVPNQIPWLNAYSNLFLLRHRMR